MENTIHKPYKTDDMKKGKKKIPKCDKHMIKNTGMWTNSVEMELRAKMLGVKVLALTSNWTLPLTMYKGTNLLWINLANIKGLKMKLEVFP